MSISRAQSRKIRLLQTKKGRRESGHYVAEGVRLLETARENRILPKQLFYAVSLLNQRGKRLVKQMSGETTEVIETSAADVHMMADVKNSAGMIGVFEIPETALGQLYHPGLRTILLCENIADPGNLGTLIRSARAFGIDLVLLAGSCAEPYAPKVVRASMGGIFGLPMALVTMSEVERLLAEQKLSLVVADAHGGTDSAESLASTNDAGIILAIGSEAEGPTVELRKAAHRTVRIQHESAMESLNSAVAGAILMRELYDLKRRRER